MPFRIFSNEVTVAVVIKTVAVAAYGNAIQQIFPAHIIKRSCKAVGGVISHVLKFVKIPHAVITIVLDITFRSIGIITSCSILPSASGKKVLNQRK